MKVVNVLVGATTRTGGPPAFVGGCVRELTRLGHQMPVLATDLARAPHGLFQREQTTAGRGDLHPDLATADLRLFPARAPRRLARSPELRRALAAAAAQADIVHIHNLWLYPQLVAYRAALSAEVPYVVSLHGAFDPYLQGTGRVRKRGTMALWQRRMLERAALIHVTTVTELRAAAGVAPAVPRAVVPCGVYTAAFGGLPASNAFRDRHLDGYAGPVILFLGRVTDKKGLDVLIRAFALTRAAGDCRLAIVGPDDEGLTPRLLEVARMLGVRDEVIFVGPLYAEDRLAALAACDVWALSSHTENFGIAVVEAMAAGCAVVVSPGVNIAAEVQTADAGVVAPPVANAFGDALKALLADGSRRAAMQQRAKAFAARYDWSLVGPQMAAAYDLVLARRG